MFEDIWKDTQCFYLFIGFISGIMFTLLFNLVYDRFVEPVTEIEAKIETIMIKPLRTKNGRFKRKS